MGKAFYGALWERCDKAAGKAKRGGRELWQLKGRGLRGPGSNSNGRGQQTDRDRSDFSCLKIKSVRML